MILGHHGGELPLVLATLAGSGAILPLLATSVRARLGALGERLRRQEPGT